MTNEMSKSVSSDDAGWDMAIRDASVELEKIEVRSKQLQRAIRNFEANKRDGLPCPLVARTPPD